MLRVKRGFAHDVIPFVALSAVRSTPSRGRRTATTPRAEEKRRCHTGDRNTLVFLIRSVVHAQTFHAMVEFVPLAAAVRAHAVVTPPVCAELASGAGGLPVTGAADNWDQSE